MTVPPAPPAVLTRWMWLWALRLPSLEGWGPGDLVTPFSLGGLCFIQVVLWVGLGILVVSTHTTLSVSEETPVDLDLAKGAPGSRLGEAQGEVKAKAARLPGTWLSGTCSAPRSCTLLGVP